MGSITHTKVSAIADDAAAAAAGDVVPSDWNAGHTFSLTASDVGLSNVTNNAQTRAAIVPNTAPTAGQVLVGNAGGTAYAPVALSGDVTVTSAGVTAIGAGKVTEAMQVLADNTAGNVSTAAHGYAPKAPNDATKFLNGTGAYSVPAGGSPAGASLTLQYNNASSFGGMSGTSWDDTNRSLTITGATVTTSNPIINSSQTWNAAGVTFDADLIAITSTASASGSTVINRKVGGSSVFSVDKSGNGVFAGQLTFGTFLNSASIRAMSGQAYFNVHPSFIKNRAGCIIGWVASTTDANNNHDTAMARNAAGVIEINNGTAGTFADLKLRNLIPGASLATNMTDGFFNAPGAAGVPSGTPNNTTGFPMYWDSTNLQLYVYTGGAWKKSAAFT